MKMPLLCSQEKQSLPPRTHKTFFCHLRTIHMQDLCNVDCRLAWNQFQKLWTWSAYVALKGFGYLWCIRRRDHPHFKRSPSHIAVDPSHTQTTQTWHAIGCHGDPVYHQKKGHFSNLFSPKISRPRHGYQAKTLFSPPCVQCHGRSYPLGHHLPHNHPSLHMASIAHIHTHTHTHTQCKKAFSIEPCTTWYMALRHGCKRKT